jgi:tagaturonate epimerase
MPLTELMTSLQEYATKPRTAEADHGTDGNILNVYPRSVRIQDNILFLIGREKTGKYLYVVTNEVERMPFDGEPVSRSLFGERLKVKRCPLNHTNAEILREMFRFTRPVLLGLADSFGFGDRLGIANPAHIRSLAGSHMRPVLAQQSIRELDRTQRTAGEVLDAASWAVFQEGFTTGFGADADHLKTTDDIDRYARAGFTMYTFDPSAHVINEAVKLTVSELKERARKIESNNFQCDECLIRYAGKTFKLEDGTVLQPSVEDISCAFVKYGGVILHTVILYKHLKEKYPSLATEVELSVDETDIPTTPTEHLFIAGELKRLGVQWVSLAPRFIGDFEKGVDYRGDLNAFAAEYSRHVGIAKMFGPYKISIHSGSDKFGVYEMIGSLRQGNVHVKTAGTSYLEALRTISIVEPNLIREILDYSRIHYTVARQSYHVTACLDRVPESKDCTDKQLQDLFNQHDARQVFHVTFGQVLSARDAEGRSLFRDRFMACLNNHEDVHYETLIRHFRKHLDPFKRKK